MEETMWIQDTYNKIINKMRVVADRNRDKIPYTTVNGIFNDCGGANICWWTNGFWGGMMWQLYYATKEELYREIAEENERKLDRNLMEYQGMDHDSGFKWLPTAVADYKLTGSRKSRNRAILAADNLAGRFNVAGEFIRAWNDEGDGAKAGWAIIDCMMNLPLLYWAYEEIRDPRYLHIAKKHADTAMKYFVRPDGSVNHIVEFDAYTGEYAKSYGGQGYAEGSSWTRGQAWAVYGFVLSYIHTKKQAYLECAEKIADYFISSIPDNGLIPVDFRQPADVSLEDSTAAAIAACGLLEIEKHTGKEKYRNAALGLIKTLAEKRCCWSEDCDNLLEKCTAAFHDKEHEFSIIYGDYYFIEAIWKLMDKELFIW